MAGPRIDDLRPIPLFRGFTDEELGELAGVFSPAEVRAGGVLFEVDEPAQAFFLVTAGEVVLDRPGDDQFLVRPPALIGELGGLAGLFRNVRAVASAGAVVWQSDAMQVQRHLAGNQLLGIRFLVNLLELVADKIQRDQRRIFEMRGRLVETQRTLKSLQDIVVEAPETPISAAVHDALGRLIVDNRRVNYRVEPPPALAASVRLDAGRTPVFELSRTHMTLRWPGPPPAVGDRVFGVMELPGVELPLAGSVIRVGRGMTTLKFDPMIDEYVAALEGYLTRIQLLDVLC
jgi:CRP-like cAMP-binding protein